MELMRVIGSRRSIRWFRTWQPVEPERIQRILEAARMTGCPGNLQPKRRRELWSSVRLPLCIPLLLGHCFGAIPAPGGTAPLCFGYAALQVMVPP